MYTYDSKRKSRVVPRLPARHFVLTTRGPSERNINSRKLRDEYKYEFLDRTSEGDKFGNGVTARVGCPGRFSRVYLSFRIRWHTDVSVGHVARDTVNDMCECVSLIVPEPVRWFTSEKLPESSNIVEYGPKLTRFQLIKLIIYIF